MASIWERIAREPIGMIALVATVGISLLENDWLWRQIDGELVIVAHHVQVPTGQCSLAAMTVDNRSSRIHGDISIHLVEDWITKRGDESINFGQWSEMLVPPGVGMPIPHRAELGVEYSRSRSTIQIPKMAPGQYIDFLFARETVQSMETARRNLANDQRYWNTPRVEYAASDRGAVRFRAKGECLEKSP